MILAEKKNISTSSQSLARLHLEIHGRVQGVGFRPFVWNLAQALGLTGWVRNSSEGVQIEVEGPKELLGKFLNRLKKESPPNAEVESIEIVWLGPKGYQEFQIQKSGPGKKTAGVLPDLATCPDCLKEILDPNDRRYRYPFTNCTRCGPRFSILQALPYDRMNTTMKGFSMCSFCQAEYSDPGNRRFHAQPNACKDCGPTLSLFDDTGKKLATGETALLRAEEGIREGKILALKGLGGFHLMTDARCEKAVQELRQRKRRPGKPFALMFPNIELVRSFTEANPLEAELLQSPASPIVLLKKRGTPAPYSLASNISPANPYYGVLLPYTPLHHILMMDLGFPVVATSGNLSEEPICIDGDEARERLKGIADLFLDHNRPIARPVEDSVVQVIAGAATVLRRSRGYAPLPFEASGRSGPILAVGGHQKNTVALAHEGQIVLSQHLGDLETPPARQAFTEVIDSLEGFYEVTPKKIACDLHPDYSSTRWAQQKKSELTQIQHHHAHVVSCMAEHGLTGTVLGVAWDGVGYGTDGTLWGGEFLRCNRENYQRLGHLRSFPLPGGEQAIREPRRAALGLLYEIFKDSLFQDEELISLPNFPKKQWAPLRTILQKGIHTPRTCGAGRLFDAVAALLGLKAEVSFEGEGAMALEYCAGGNGENFYPLELRGIGKQFILDWEPMIREILRDINMGIPKKEISLKFHNGLTQGILQGALRSEEKRVVLTGGCFQNKILSEGAIRGLREQGLVPFWHQRVPPNDGGIALGQAVIASERGKNDPCV